MEMDQGNESSHSKAVNSLKKTFRRILIIIVILAILVIGFVGWSFHAAIYKWQSPEAATVEIEHGLAVQAIAQMLADNGVIRTPQIFSAYVRIRGLGSKVKAGEYEFPAGLNANDVLNMLVKGEVKKYQLQIIEGWTIKDIVKDLSDLQFLKDPAIPQEFERLVRDKAFIESLGFKDIPSLEGYLFPDTYEVLRPKTADEIIKRLVARFREIYTPETTALVDKLGQTQQQIVTLASIIEKETGKNEERPLISSVFWNRLKQNMPLQSDPTIIYGIPNFNGNLTREDLDNGANPYNTYMHLGLPPGPICNPGKSSIDAALQPAGTKYLYFVSKNDGTHIFSENLEEHQRAVAQYQLGRAFAGPAEAPPTGEIEPTPPAGVTAIPPLVTPKGGITVPPQTPPAAAPPVAAAPQVLPGPSIIPAAPAAPAAPTAPTAPAAPAAPAPAMPAPAPSVPPATVTTPTPAPTTPAVPAYPPKPVTPVVPTTMAPITPAAPSPLPAQPTLPPTTPAAPAAPAAPTPPTAPAAPATPQAQTPPAATQPMTIQPPAVSPTPAMPPAPAAPATTPPQAPPQERY